jgi:hypothetical protein
MTRDAVLAEAERQAHILAEQHAPGGREWTRAVAQWAQAQPVQAQACLRTVYWRQTHGQMTGRPALSPELMALLVAAERVWRQVAQPTTPRANDLGASAAKETVKVA